MKASPGTVLSLGLLLCTGCLQRAIAVAATPGTEGCEDSTTLYDADGTVHVLGCGSVQTYRCTDRLVNETHVEEVTAPVRYETRYDALEKKWVYERKGGDTTFEPKTTLGVKTDCKPDTPEQSPTTLRPATPPQKPPSVERSASDGQIKLRLDLVLNREALLKLSALPKVRSDGVHFRLSRRQLDRDLDKCQLGVLVNGQAVSAGELNSKRDGEMFADSFWIDGAALATFDGIKKLSLTSCDRRWFLTRDQILSVREFMSQFREEVTLLAPPARPPAGDPGGSDSPPEPAAPKVPATPATPPATPSP